MACRIHYLESFGNKRHLYSKIIRQELLFEPHLNRSSHHKLGHSVPDDDALAERIYSASFASRESGRPQQNKGRLPQLNGYIHRVPSFFFTNDITWRVHYVCQSVCKILIWFNHIRSCILIKLSAEEIQIFRNFSPHAFWVWWSSKIDYIGYHFRMAPINRHILNLKSHFKRFEHISVK